MSVIEFQKRSLPRCHMLVILRNENEIQNRNDIDRIVSAEIPDPMDPALHDLVKKIMFQVPCTIDNPSASAWKMIPAQKIFRKNVTVIQSTKDKTLELECKLDFTMLTKGTLCLLIFTYSKSTMLILIHTQKILIHIWKT